MGLTMSETMRQREPTGAGSAASAVPRYDDLPRNDALGMNHCWGVFGPDDQVGTLNFLTDDVVAAAMSEVNSGRRFNLSLPLDVEVSPHRGVPRHHVWSPKRNMQDDLLDNFYLQGSTQWDGLRHIGAREFGYYNGTTAEEAGPQGAKLGIAQWPNHGVVGRGVLVDVARYLERRGEPLAPTEQFAISIQLIEQVLAAQAVELRRGDILLLRTGYLAGLWAQGRTSSNSSPGLAATEDVARFLWDHEVAAVVADNPAVEMAPGDGKNFLHRRLIPMLGMALGELFDLDSLAEACAEDGRYTCCFVAVPLNLPRGVGSTGNAVAIR
jgi:kynurenine formamidase